MAVPITVPIAVMAVTMMTAAIPVAVVPVVVAVAAVMIAVALLLADLAWFVVSPAAVLARHAAIQAECQERQNRPFAHVSSPLHTA